MEEIKRIQGLVEDVLRGKLLDEEELMDECKKFLVWSSTKYERLTAKYVCLPYNIALT